MKARDLAERIEQHINRTAGCWEWQGSKRGHGYGRIKVNGRTYPAHRFLWELTNGLVPAGMLVLHKCDNPPCVRPDHLYLGTSADNTRDMVVRGRQRNIKKTHCLNGHLFTLENTSHPQRKARSWRCCRKCEADRKLIYASATKATS